MKIDNEYYIGDTVYLKTDEEQLERIVIEIKISPGDILLYSLACGEKYTSHYAMEMTDKKQLKL